MKGFKNFHFIGIGGIGMSALAEIALARGWSVTGSDRKESSITQSLVARGAKISFEQNSNTGNFLIRGIDPKDLVVISSSAVKPSNNELVAARQAGCTVWHRSDLLAFLTKDTTTYAVAGTHGKTTTSSLLATVFNSGNNVASFAIGGIVERLGTNGLWNNNSPFIIEADESDGTLVKYHPKGAIVTNVDTDHMDHYGTEDVLHATFRKFIRLVEDRSLLWCCGDDPFLATTAIGETYGFSKGCSLWIDNFSQNGWRTRFNATLDGQTYRDIELAMPGRHSVLNAAGVFGLGVRAGVDEEAIRHAFREFQGARRRCQQLGDVQGILLLDDYAHHPTEIEVTLAAIKHATPERRLVAVFQPHRYTRTGQCLGTFGGVFDAADWVVITDLYASGENPISGVDHDAVLKEVPSGEYLPRKELAKMLLPYLKEGDVVVTLGAGDITQIGGDLLEMLNCGAVT